MPFALVTGLASLGVLETVYLTIVKLTSSPLACPTSGCDEVLNSSYATLFGLPLSTYGALAYAAVGVLAASGMKKHSSGQQVPDYVNVGLAAGAALLATCSAALMYILNTKLGGAPCIWCYTSATISFATLAGVVWGLDRRQLADVAGPSISSVALAVALLYFGLGSGDESLARSADFELPYQQPILTTESTPRGVDLARRLRAAGAKMYGAFWCSHCYDQKQEFGAQAMADFPYVECFPTGWKKGVKIEPVCEAAKVQAFPTWVIGSTFHEGALTFDQLEAILDKMSPQPAPELISMTDETAALLPQ